MTKEYNDEDFRKKREWVGFFASWVAGSFMYSFAAYYTFLFSIIFYIIGSFCAYEALRCIVTYDFTKWKKSMLWIFFGCFFGIIGGYFVYLYLKRKELKNIIIEVE